jgi:hypothetical protein
MYLIKYVVKLLLRRKPLGFEKVGRRAEIRVRGGGPHYPPAKAGGQPGTRFP